MAATPLTLSEYIARVGDETFAARFGISRWTARDYRLRASRPSTTMAMRIIRATRGRVGWDGIYYTRLRRPKR